MPTKPGASPHCGKNAVAAPSARARIARGRGDVLGQVEIVRAGIARGARDLGVQEERRGADDRVLAGAGPVELRRVRRVEDQELGAGGQMRGRFWSASVTA